MRRPNSLGLPPEQPSDDGAEELVRRAPAVVERRWHLGTPPAVPGSPETNAAHRLRLRSLLRVTRCSRFHPRERVSRADEELAAQIAAKAPFGGMCAKRGRAGSLMARLPQAVPTGASFPTPP